MSGRAKSQPAADHDRFAFDDAAYLLGGLDASDRLAFEQHLARCWQCRSRWPNWASCRHYSDRVDLGGLEVEPPPVTLLPKLLDEVGRQRTRRSWRTAAIGFVAACVLALLVAGGIDWYTSAHQPRRSRCSGRAEPGRGQGLGQVARLGPSRPGSSSTAAMRTRAAAIRPMSSPPAYRMVVYNRLGMMRDLGSWTPQPGEDVQITRNSPWSKQALSKIEIANEPGRRAAVADPLTGRPADRRRAPATHARSHNDAAIAAKSPPRTGSG